MGGGAAAGPNAARVINQVTHGLGAMGVWVRLPLVGGGPATAEEAAADAGAAVATHDGATPPAPPTTAPDPWLAWQALRSLGEASTRLGVVLQLPATPPPPGCLDRWIGEPLRAAILPAAAFTPNRRGCPVLGRAHQAALGELFAAGVQVILSGPPPPPGRFTLDTAVAGPAHAAPTPATPWPAPYWEYLAFLFRRPPPPDTDAALEASYRDYLQAPLQPLQDNLESQTYETFERDAAKYEAYGEAVRRLLEDRARVEKKMGAGGGGGSADSPTVIMVVGAGRGPLVAASLAAADAVGAAVRLYAVEKNPNAVITLQGRLAGDPAWGPPRGAPPGTPARVTLVAGDMRGWTPPERADVLVSELLGSFGDNELSPECLDGAERLLKRAGEGGPGEGGAGISIPSAYTSFLQPVTASRLWADVKGYDDLEHAETPYVVKLHRFSPLAATAAVFTFAHPRGPGLATPAGGECDAVMGDGNGAETCASTADDPATLLPDPRDNARYTSLTYDRAGAPAALVHGLAGFFETHLYGGVTLSTHPPTHTPGMASWFPIFFPLATPLLAPAGTPLTVHMWRCVSPVKVWYEWAAAVGGGAGSGGGGAATHIHNVNGRSYFVGL